MKKRTVAAVGVGTLTLAFAAVELAGCGSNQDDGVVTIEMVQYKPEAVDVFEELEQKFNETHEDIQLVIDSPNDAMTILKTRFIREDYPDIVAIGGDINYSNFLDAGLFMDISDFDGLEDIKQAYLDMDKELEYVPMDGVYAVPYMANGMSLYPCVRRFSRKVFSLCISDIVMCGPVWRRGMRWRSIWLRRMSAIR